MPKIVVFLGPSLPVERANQILRAEYRSPAKRGDIYRASEEGANIICLIDGVFFQECSVAHKEILHALEVGTSVLGASSMGALRASELDVYGMEGVGEIYKAYKRGDLTSDDEVALIFDPLTFEPLSEPLVNIRYNLKIASELGIIDNSSADQLLKAAQSLYFPARNYNKIIQASLGIVPQRQLESFKSFLMECKRDLKMEDAIELLRRAKIIFEEKTIKN